MFDEGAPDACSGYLRGRDPRRGARLMTNVPWVPFRLPSSKWRTVPALSIAASFAGSGVYVVHHGPTATSVMSLTLTALVLAFVRARPSWSASPAGAVAGCAVASSALLNFLGVWYGTQMVTLAVALRAFGSSTRTRE